MGCVTKETRRRKPAWCVRNEATGKIIRAGGKERCYATRYQATKVWSALDCKYTGRRCDRVISGGKWPAPV